MGVADNTWTNIPGDTLLVRRGDKLKKKEPDQIMCSVDEDEIAKAKPIELELCLFF